MRTIHCVATLLVSLGFFTGGGPTPEDFGPGEEGWLEGMERPVQLYSVIQPSGVRGRSP